MRTKPGYKLRMRFSALALLCIFSAGNLPTEAGTQGKPIAVTINDNHPDLPLKLFAAGKLGVIRPDWAKSYLLVTYRYLSANPLDPVEQAGVVKMWHQRIKRMRSLSGLDEKEDASVDYFKLRAKVLGSKLTNAPSRYDFEFNYEILDDAFLNAKSNLQTMMTTFGPQSTEVSDWLKAQDAVFGCNKDRVTRLVPPDLASQNPIVKRQRKYQIAAAQFYLQNLEAAKQNFEELANESSQKDLPLYMAARCAIDIALKSKKPEWAQTKSYIEKLIADNPNSKYKNDLLNLSKSIGYLLDSPEESLKNLCSSVLKAHSNRFGDDVGDLSSFMAGTGIQTAGDYDSDASSTESKAGTNSPGPLPLDKFELTDWLNTIQEPSPAYLNDEEKHKQAQEREKAASHALERWRNTHTLPWLVAALSSNKLGGASNPDLLQAAKKVPANSCAYPSCSFFIVDDLLQRKQMSEARKKLQEILARKDLTPSTRNIFLCQMQMASNSVKEYLNSMIQANLATCPMLDDIQFPDDWQTAEKRSTYYSKDSTLSNLHADDVNCNLPQSRWVEWAMDRTVPKALHANLIRAAWVRSVILGKESSTLENELVVAYPQLLKAMDHYRNAPAGPEKRYALSCLIMMNTGMSPYVEPIDHHGGLNEFNYYQGNFWVPAPETEKQRLAARAEDEDLFNVNEVWHNTYRGCGFDSISDTLTSYDVPVLRKLLTAQETSQLDAERKLIAQRGPAHLLTVPVLDWARSHPDDATIPEMLYRVVKLPLWTPKTPLGSKYSHQALMVLHKQYPKNKWSKKVKYSY